MVVIAKTSNKLIRIREFHIDYVGHAQAADRTLADSAANCSSLKPCGTSRMSHLNRRGIASLHSTCGSLPTSIIRQATSLSQSGRIYSCLPLTSEVSESL